MSATITPRRGRALVVSSALMLAACELVTGLTGDRELASATAQGGGGGSGTGTGPSAGTSAGGTSSGVSGSGTIGGGAGTPDAGDGNGGDLPGGQGGGAGASDEGGAGGVGGDPDGPLNPILSCDEATVCAGESACTTIYLRGGEVPIGRSLDGPDAAPLYGEADEVPEHTVRLSPFWLDKYEVTVGRFRRFVESYTGSPLGTDAGAHPAVPGSGWKIEWNDRLPADRLALEQLMITRSSEDSCNEPYRTWTEAVSNNECLPINCIDWYISFAFCIWDGGRLPTEAEWEFAAAGGDENRLYPWGSRNPDNTLAVYECRAGGDNDCSPIDIAYVGSLGATGYGLFGHADLAGLMFERTRDVYDPTYYEQAAARIDNPVNLALDATLSESTARGGCFISTADGLRVSRRLPDPRINRSDIAGIRCARNP